MCFPLVSGLFQERKSSYFTLFLYTPYIINSYVLLVWFCEQWSLVFLTVYSITFLDTARKEQTQHFRKKGREGNLPPLQGPSVPDSAPLPPCPTACRARCSRCWGARQQPGSPCLRGPQSLVADSKQTWHMKTQRTGGRAKCIRSLRGKGRSEASSPGRPE